MASTSSQLLIAQAAPALCCFRTRVVDLGLEADSIEPPLPSMNTTAKAPIKIAMLWFARYDGACYTATAKPVSNRLTESFSACWHACLRLFCLKENDRLNTKVVEKHTHLHGALRRQLPQDAASMMREHLERTQAYLSHLRTKRTAHQRSTAAIQEVLKIDTKGDNHE
ncbi:hypothetical protein H0A71_13595 [Alcaligenaceae bacterium]|nr:hypothetical protein [Alcaligenaceae bacterium]